MNEERIKKLAKQAYEDVIKNTPSFLVTKELYEQKFAELIVAECIEQVRGEFLPVLEDEAMMKDTHWDGYVQCGVDSVVAIREHFFGVEE